MYSHALIQIHYLEYYLKNNFGKQERKKTAGKRPNKLYKIIHNVICNVYAMQFTFQYTLVAYEGII